MKLRCFLSALVFVLLCAGTAFAKPDPIEMYIEASLTGDTATLDKLLAPNYLHVNGNGYLQDKEHFIDSLKSQAMIITRITVTDVKESSFANTRLYTGSVVFRGKFEPKLTDGLHRVTMVVEDQGNESKVLLFQATPVRKGSYNSTDLMPPPEPRKKKSAE